MRRPETARVTLVNARRRIVAESIGAAAVMYAVAGGSEAALIRGIRPTALELAWVSDIVLSAAFGVVVYLWRHLLASRRELAERERADLVMQTQLSLAAEMQRHFLPPVPSAAGGLDWAATLVSAGKVGGDFYDFVEQPMGTWLVLIADVSGKGIPAAMAIGSLRAMFRTLARDSQEPASLAAGLSAAVRDEWHGAPYVTCIIARFETYEHRLTYTNAGHPPGILLGTRTSRSLNRGGPPAGLLPTAQFEQEIIELQAGDICLFVSDGVTEALEDSPQPVLDVIVTTAREHSSSATSICHAVMARAQEGLGPPGVPQWDDDRTVVVVTVVR
jgi:sigma-B regulation protein RsbU (phosphoserine phosphatase)